MRSLLTRRSFLKLNLMGFGTLGLQPWGRLFKLLDFPQEERLGRVVVGKVDIKARPDIDSQTIGALYEDAIVPWLREAVGPRPYRVNQRWVETPDGFIWSPDVQPVRNQPNIPVDTLPETSLGEGMWMEVSVPHVDLIQANPPARAPWLLNRQKSGLPQRFFYSQIVWADQIKVDTDGQVWYRLNEQYGYGDIFWGAAEAFRPLTEDELSPISPEVEEKRISVDLTTQTMSCFEGNSEVYFAPVSTGMMNNILGKQVDDWGTPIGRHRIWRKTVSLPLTGGSAESGWALPAVGWISLFVGSGVAFHSTYWHNNYGVPTSRGCVNCKPDDAKWIFRWTLPAVPYDPGDMTVGMPGGTQIDVVET